MNADTQPNPATPGDEPASLIRILVVDDNPSIHDDFRKILCPTGDTAFLLKSAEFALFDEDFATGVPTKFEVDSALQGQEALAKVQEALKEGRPYLLAFVDIRMPPGWDGVETIERIWRVDPNVQVVICTAYSDYSWEQLSRRFSASDSLLILKKPFDHLEVLQLAHTLSTKWRLSRQARLRIADLDRAVAARSAELQLSEERFARAFLASPAPLALQTAQDQRFFDVNNSFLDMVGYQRPDVVGRTPDDLSLYVGEDLGKQLRQAASLRAPVRSQQCQFRARNGELRSVLLSAEPLGIGSEHFLLLLAQDVTEQLKLETQLRQAQKMQAIGQLAAGVAHDFNNILTVITGHVQLALARPRLDPPIAETLKVVGNAAERAATLTRQLLAFSRQQLINPKPLEVCQVLQNLSKMLQSVLGEHIRLVVECEPGLAPVLADAGGLAQVLVNLTVNARDARPDGGQLTVRAEHASVSPSQALAHPDAEAGQFIRLSVSDTGCGMAADTLGRLFEPFFTTKEVGQGTGLGLATAYGIVRQHRGWIEVASQPGRGSTFRVFLPCSAQTAAPPPAPAPAPPGDQPAVKGKTVLLVEDEDALRALAALILERFGCQVLSAASGDDALEVWQQHGKKNDLLFTDMVMPGRLNGKDLAARLTAERPELRVIYTSGYTVDFQTGGLQMEEGVNFLAKPYNPQKLANILDRAVRNHRR